MELFKSPEESHQHSLEVLNQLYDHDDFMDSISSVMDLGCGTGHDILWWANAKTREDHPQPHNYRCIGVDRDLSKFAFVTPKNLRVVESDFTTDTSSTQVDLLWSHNSLQYAENPAATLRHWNSMLNDGGMAIIMVPQTVNVEFNRWVSQTFSHQLFSFTIVNLIYMLACAGFDCKDGLFLKKKGDPWLYAAVYKSEHAPVSPADTTWYELVDRGLLPDSADKAIKKAGYLSQHDLITRWIDKTITEWARV